MSRRIVAVLYLVSALSVLAAERAPRIQFDRSTYDFGKTSDAESVTGKFIFTNIGTSTLKVGTPAVSCGCTVASVNPEKLEPGEKGELTFTLTLGTARATLLKHITVPSNDPEHPQVELTIKADHVPVYQVLPSSFRITVRQGESTNMTAKFVRTDDKELKIGKVETSHPWITCRTEMLDKQTARLSLDIKPDGDPRPLAESVQIYAEGLTAAAGSIFISGRVVGEFVVTPELLFWNVGAPEPPNADGTPRAKIRRVTVTPSAPGKSFELTHATSSVHGLNVEIARNDQGYELVASLAEPPTQNVRGVIQAETNLPGQPTVMVPVILNVYRPR
jgi:hypothetical protein